MSRSQGAANQGWPPRHPPGEADPRAQGRPAPQAPQGHAPQGQGGRGQAPVYDQQQYGAAGYTPQHQPYADPHSGYADPQGAPSYGGQQGYHYPQDQHPAQPPQYQPAQPQQHHQQPVQRQAPAASAQPQYAQPQQQAPRAPQPAPTHRQQPQTQPPQYAPPRQAQPQPQSAQPPVNRQGLSSLDSARAAQQPVHDFNNFPRTQPPQAQPPQYAQSREQVPPQQQNGRAAPAQPQYAQPAPVHPSQSGRQSQPPAYNVPNADLGARGGDGYGRDAGQYGAGLEPPAPAYQHAPSYDQWPPAQQQQRPSLDAFGQNQNHLASAYPGVAADYAATAGGDYALSNGAGADPYGDPLQTDWGISGAAGYGDPAIDPQGFDHQGGYAGYDQQHGGALEPATYNAADELNGYEAEEPRRASWAMRIAGALVVAIGLGYGLAQAYQAVVGGPVDNGAPPVIASDDTPAKERPSDPGGRQFSHTDSKVLGRLEQIEGGDGGLHESDQANGTRKVSTLVVGRDGSIMPPADDVPDTPVSVPGMMVVDAFGTGNSPTAQMPRQPEPQDHTPPARPTVNVKSTRVIPATTASVEEEEPAPPRRQTVAAAPPATSAPRAPTGANGYVVVLSSVPASGSSRLDALRKFADMQQQYGPVLANKTPDVRETTLAGKGAYHRLLVGPPGSKNQANELCIQLKASGYNDCWVTAY